MFHGTSTTRRRIAVGGAVLTLGIGAAVWAASAASAAPAPASAPASGASTQSAFWDASVFWDGTMAPATY